MKVRFILSLLMAAVFVFAACSGDDGEPGAAGPAGTDGFPAPMKILFAPAEGTGNRDNAMAGLLKSGGLTLVMVTHDEHLAEREFFVGGRYTIADIGIYGYTHVAREAGYEMNLYPAVQSWLERVAAQPGHVADLAPYPPNARPGAGQSIYG